MFQKPILFIILATFAALAFNTAAYAQMAPLNGHVVLEKDGKSDPVPSAVIDVYRTDVKGYYNTKTDKKGEFRFVGIPYGDYVLAVSAPGCTPTLFPTRAGQENLVIKMDPGDGHKFTEAEARNGATGAMKSGEDGSGGISAEEKKDRAEKEKQNAEISARNEKMKNADAIAAKSFTEGNAALDPKNPNYNLDVALTKFNEGIAAVPDYVGSTPVLLNGKMLALKGKAYQIYKDGAASADPTVKTAKYAEANKLYDDALEAFQRALAILKSAEATNDAVDLKRREDLTLKLYEAAAEVHRLKASLDQSKSAEAAAVFTEYIAMLTDPVKKIDVQMKFGDTMRRSYDFTRAVEAFRQVLVLKPDHAEAMGWLGLALVGQATAKDPEDKEMEQEGLNYMQKYIELSPVSATDTPAVQELKKSIKEAVDYLKSQKMAPQKVPSAPKRKN